MGALQHALMRGARAGALAVTGAAILLASGTAASGTADEDASQSATAGRSATSAWVVGDARRIAPSAAGEGVRAAGTTARVLDCRYDLDGEGALDPSLVEACMVVWPDDVRTPADESSMLWVEGKMGAETNVRHKVEVGLDVNGDDQIDYSMVAPAMPQVEVAYAGAVARVTGATKVLTGQSATWRRVSAEVRAFDGYLVGLDWRTLGLAQAGFALRTSVDADNWIAVPGLGFSTVKALPRSAAPSAPRGVSGLAGDRRATVKWLPPASMGASRITRYTVVSMPGGRTCTTTGRSCVVTRLKNQQAYRFRVTAHNAVGSSSWSAPSRVVVPRPFVQVSVRPKSKASKLRVDVNPNKGSGYWTFRVQKRTSGGAWASLGSYRTKGAKETRTVNLPKGAYRVVVAAKYGYQGNVSATVALAK